jgi:Family of unknown function (DUF5518)
MNNKLKPALIGGVVLGILSVIPFVSAGNLCCCLWAILGGMLASYLYIKNSPTPATAADGAVLGALAGVVGAAIDLVIGIPINYAMGPTMRNLMLRLIENADPRQAEVMRRQLEAGGDTIASHIFQGLIAAVLLFVFALIGGLLGVAIFEKRKGGAPPSPPINVGGPVGGAPGGYAA